MAQNYSEKQYWSEELSGKGYLGDDPKLITKHGAKMPIAVARVAASSRTNDNEGVPQDRTRWRSLKFFGYTAEQVMETLTKGDYIYYKGRVNPNSYIDKNGNERESDEILVDVISTMLPKLGGDSSGSSRGGSSRGSSSRGSRRSAPVEDDYDDYDDEGDPAELEDEPTPSRSGRKSRSSGQGRSSRSGRRSSRATSNDVELDDDIDDYSTPIF